MCVKLCMCHTGLGLNSESEEPVYGWLQRAAHRGEALFCLQQQPGLFLRIADWGKSLLMLCRNGTTGYSHSGCVSTSKFARRAGTQQFGSNSFWQCILFHLEANLPSFLFVGGALQWHWLWFTVSVFLLFLAPHVDGISQKIFQLIHSHLWKVSISLLHPDQMDKG